MIPAEFYYGWLPERLRPLDSEDQQILTVVKGLTAGIIGLILTAAIIFNPLSKPSRSRREFDERQKMYSTLLYQPIRNHVSLAGLVGLGAAGAITHYITSAIGILFPTTVFPWMEDILLVISMVVFPFICPMINKAAGGKEHGGDLALAMIAPCYSIALEIYYMTNKATNGNPPHQIFYTFPFLMALTLPSYRYGLNFPQPNFVNQYSEHYAQIITKSWGFVEWVKRDYLALICLFIVATVERSARLCYINNKIPQVVTLTANHINLFAVGFAGVYIMLKSYHAGDYSWHWKVYAAAVMTSYLGQGTVSFSYVWIGLKEDAVLFIAEGGTWLVRMIESGAFAVIFCYVFLISSGRAIKKARAKFESTPQEEFEMMLKDA